MAKKSTAAGQHNSNKGRNRKAFIVTVAGFAGAILFFLIAVPYLFPPVSTGKLVPIAVHKHAYLDITVDGQEVKIPSGVGLVSSLYHDHSLDQYAVGDNHAPIHTHDDGGLIHVEASGDNERKDAFTVGRFLDIWGYQIPDNAQVSLTVGYKETSSIVPLWTYIPTAENYRDHVIEDGEHLRLEVNTK